MLSIFNIFFFTQSSSHRATKKYGRKVIVNSHQLLEKEMYMSCITVAMVLDSDNGDMAVTW